MPIVRAEALRNTESGPVALLGNGPTLKHWPLDRLSCPAIGINTSWQKHKSKYHSFVAGSMVSQLNSGFLNSSEAIFFPFRYKARLTAPFVRSAGNTKLIPVQELVKQKTLQWDLIKGSDATFGGIFAIQIAIFLGFTSLYLLGYDEHNSEGHFTGDSTEVADREGTHLSWYPLVKETTAFCRIDVFVCNRDSAIRIWPFADPPLDKSGKI